MNKKLKIGVSMAIALGLGAGVASPMVSQPIEANASAIQAAVFNTHAKSTKSIQVYNYKKGNMVKYKVLKPHIKFKVLNSYRNGYYQVKIGKEIHWMKAADVYKSI